MANPTTNYGFVLPTSSDLVTDLPADFDVALQGVDTRLKALQPGTTAGDLAYSSATANTNTRLPIGTAGQVLQVNSGATAPQWATLGNGKVLQVVQVSYSTSTTVASTSLTDTGLTASITPSSTSSKILVLVNQNVNFERFSAPIGINLNILRGATNIFAQNGSENTASNYADGSYVQTRAIIAFSYLDSPNTTSSTTYKTQGSASTTANSGQVKFQSGSAISTITLMEIGA
jgi:hypothetical protein